MSKQQLLVQLHRRITTCHRCLLYKTATYPVPGEGNPHTRIMFIGEAPGRVEDETGKPFVGRAGKLLDELLISIGLQRKSVFITSLIKHRPPKNRQPKPKEVKACKYWISQQLAIIEPKLIISLGRFSLDYFLPKKKISRIHGTIQKRNKFIIFPMYHPAAGLRSTRNKETLFADFNKLKSFLDVIS